MFSFVLTFYGYKWFEHGGIKHTMIIIGSVQVAVCALSIPMCMSTLYQLEDTPNLYRFGLTFFYRYPWEEEPLFLCPP